MVGFSLSGATILARIPFTKVALGLTDQVATLEARGLIFSDKAAATEHLEHIGYYRFTGYTRPFRIGGVGADKENFRAGTTFDAAHERYIFDRKLRLIAMEGVEKIEIAARSALNNALATANGPHWYMDARFFSKPSWFDPQTPYDIAKWHADFITGIKREIGYDPTQTSRRDVFIKHYYDTYDNPDLPPCWMVFEAISFGAISRVVKHLAHPWYGDLSKKFGVPHNVLSSWFHSVSYVRNICAHHSRLWNRVCTIKPVVARAYRSEFPANDKAYAQFLVMQILIRRVWANNHWAERLAELLEEHPNVPIADMGFPVDWKKSRSWAL
ncbi:Abi family protein [Bradyrhizobium symbiodeficiens]|uniref:Abi family protein n=1 Tax=Bradyrhizobium symbiodeficiens TaxID=1404367 RepID=UPI0030CF39FE